MKKITSILLAAVTALSLASCGTKQKTAQDDSVLKVGMECNYAPYNWSQADDSNGAVPIQNVANIDWKDILIAIPAFFIIIMMPFSYSITTGIEFGFIFYAIISMYL